MSVLAVILVFFTLVALVPFLGWMNWFLAPVVLVAYLLTDADKDLGAKIVLSLAFIVSGLRLLLGSGVF